MSLKLSAEPHAAPARDDDRAQRSVGPFGLVDLGPTKLGKPRRRRRRRRLDGAEPPLGLGRGESGGADCDHPLGIGALHGRRALPA